MNWYKTFFSSYVLTLAFAALPIRAMDAPTAKEFLYTNFCKRTPTPELLEKYTETPEQEKTRHETLKFGIDWCLKDNYTVSRVRGSLLIRECAAAFGLTAVSSPVKYFTLSGYRGELIWEPMIKGIKKPFSLQQIQHLYKVFKLTGYCDIKDANILNTQEGIAYVIDTEELGFAGGSKHILNFPGYDLLAIIKSMQNLTIEADAKEWLNKKIAKYSKYKT